MTEVIDQIFMVLDFRSVKVSMAKKKGFDQDEDF